jgi:hypothetical protein
MAVPLWSTARAAPNALPKSEFFNRSLVPIGPIRPICPIRPISPLWAPPLMQPEDNPAKNSSLQFGSMLPTLSG